MPPLPLPVADANRPIYRKWVPDRLDYALLIDPNAKYIDLTRVHLPAYGASTVADAAHNFDQRAAAAVSAAVGSLKFAAMVFVPGPGPGGGHFEPADVTSELLELKVHGGDPAGGSKVPDVWIPTAACLAVIAYPDYFPEIDDAPAFRGLVSKAIMAANPGWCGTFGPGVDGLFDVIGDHAEGNYDMSQMHLLQIAYRYYDDLSPQAREKLIKELLARGAIHRPERDDIFTSGGAPDDWSSAGYVMAGPFKIRIGETENHIFSIATARYLTNQLLYQRDHNAAWDNRRNGGKGRPSCTDLMLYLLRGVLRGDFSEYNAKNYQSETRYALLNLCSYAYDHEVRLAARMVLDYVSARIAVSSSDLRRMVPFRRRNEGKNAVRDPLGFMNVSLLETTFGADPMAQHFAMLAGNTRIYDSTETYENGAVRQNWQIKTDGTDGNDAVMYALSDYRLPPAIHDLFVNDRHRRFFQRLHRTIRTDEVEGASAIGDHNGHSGRNADNMEIYAGSPSYLITAGGSPATYAIDPGPAATFAPKDQVQQLGVAVPTSFMPTMRAEWDCGDPLKTSDLIQFGRFADVGGDYNYGVAPDFACGPQVNSPPWLVKAISRDSRFGNFEFVDRGSAGKGPGFFLAFLRDGAFAVMEAFDTWLHRELKFEEFKKNVFERNKGLMARGLHSNVEERYATENGNIVHFVIANAGDDYGAKVLRVEYGAGDPADSMGDAGNVTDRFLSGTVMNSSVPGLVEITNPFTALTITLDMSDPLRPRRTSETGEVEEAGPNQEVWVDFLWKGPSEGDFFRPFATITAAAAAVIDGGVIKIRPGTTKERPTYPKNKRIRLVAPVGDVAFGVR